MKPTEDKYNAALAIGWIEELEEENQRLEATLENRKAMALADSTRIAELVNVIRNYEDQNKRYRDALQIIAEDEFPYTSPIAKQALDDKGDV